MDAIKQENIYTIEDIYALPDGERAELVDGKIYYMAPPSRTHQKISWKLHQAIANYIGSKNGKYEVYAAQKNKLFELLLVYTDFVLYYF